ncbi:nucleotidyltransferase domain-containing protein [Cytobacillus purgationiresistens]|uniref:Nucleotidyltransferase n=1 Tax=Cytobacillus purgationiresistens TaxID=863449 RepID=A0ABU0APE2_9BACI|nr:nucleotidyltransferase domain-containing protein [Cytobacillus purgationiresistens]MDQ0271925.1 putative nucleotidyltransferase [Cytobacillus purgationiresistens]
MIEGYNFNYIKGLEVVMVYGSVARNEADINSDIDIFALVVDSLTEIEREKLIEKIYYQFPAKEVNVSLYTKEIFNKMSRDGSLFLWHLKKEGKYLFNKRNENIFINLSNFDGYQKNMKLYRDLFSSVQKSLVENGVNSYDLSMLFFLCRNISILTCFKIGNPNFGRYSAYENLTKYLNYEPVSYSNFISLSKWRIDYTRGLEEELAYPNRDRLIKMINEVSNLLDVCEKIINSEDKNEEY